MTEQFKQFKIGELFTVTSGKWLSKVDQKPGKTPFISSSAKNNGIMTYINKKPLFPANTITVASHGSVGATFFQTVPYYASSNVNSLSYKNGNLSEKVGLYFVAAIQHVSKNYGFSHILSVTRTKQMEIMLPVTPVGDPDFEYMTMRIRELETQRIRELETQRIRELEAYLRVTGLDDTTLSAGEAQALTQNVKWKKFKIGDIFDIRKGRRLTKANQLSGNTPFIGSSANDHGVTGHIGQDPIFEGRTLTVSYNGSVGQVFYQTDPYWASDDINVLSLKNKDVELTPEIGNYLVTCLTMAGKGFGYNRKWNVARMIETAIELPVTADDDIDFDYMQNYIRATEKQTIKGVVEYKDKVIAETKKVVNG